MKHDNFNYLTAKMVKEKEENLRPILFYICILSALQIPHRHISIYSPIIDNSVYDWLEVWDDTEKSWQLFWLERNSYLGKTSKQRTCFDVFDEIVKGDFATSSSFEPYPIKNEFLANADLLDLANQSLHNNAKCSAFLKSTKAFPVIRSDGRYLLRAHSPLRYEDNMKGCDKKEISLAGVDYLDYNLDFADDEYIQKNVYGKQMYIMAGKYCKIE